MAGNSSPAANTDIATLLQETKPTEYAGVLSEAANFGRAHAHLRVTFDNVQQGGGGHVTVSDPLPASGPCLVRARGDSIRLTIYSGSDTLALVGTRVADTIIGTYKTHGAASRQKAGQWRVWLVSGTRIPKRLDPW